MFIYTCVSVCRLQGHRGVLYHLRWSDDGTVLLSSSDDRRVGVWEVPVKGGGTHYCLGMLEGHRARVWQACFVHDPATNKSLERPFLHVFSVAEVPTLEIFAVAPPCARKCLVIPLL